MNALLRLLLCRRDSAGRWVPVGWGSWLALAAGLILLASFAWDGIGQVRRGEKSGWRVVWWAAFGFVIWALFIAEHAYPLWSPVSIGIAVVTAAAGIAWAVLGFRKGYPLRGDEDGETQAADEQSGPRDGPQIPDLSAVLEIAQETASAHPDAHVKVVGPRPEDVERVELRWRGRRLGKRIIVQPSGEDWSLKLEALAETDLLVLPRWASLLVLALRVAALPAIALWLILALTMAYEGLGWDREILPSALVVLAAAAPFIYYVARPAGAKTSLHRVIGPLAPAETEDDASHPRDLMTEAWEWLESLTPLDVIGGSRGTEGAVDSALREYAFARGLRVKRGADRQWWIVGPRVRVGVNARPVSEVVLSDRSPGRGRVQGAVLAWAELPRLGEHLDSLRARPDEEDGSLLPPHRAGEGTGPASSGRRGG
jgi:hypothetical protein